MVTLRTDRVKQVIGSVDWGFTNPSVLQVWAIDHDGRAYMVWEFYKTGVLISDFIDVMKEARDHFRIQYFIADPSEPAYIRQCRDAGLLVREANNDVAPGIQKVQDRLTTAKDGRPRLYLLRGARTDEPDPTLQEKHKPLCTAEEIDGYVWDKVRTSDTMKEQPVKKDDHGMDAMRYLCNQLDATRSRVAVGWS